MAGSNFATELLLMALAIFAIWLGGHGVGAW